jgi:hypothetical protein
MYKKIFSGQDLSDTALTELSMFGFFVGIMFFIFGLLADILSKNYYATHKEEAYSVKEVIDNK